MFVADDRAYVYVFTYINRQFFIDQNKQYLTAQ